MPHWTSPQQLVELEAFYEKARASPESFNDEEFLAHINRAFFPTNCWAFAEAAFAIIAPGCAMRPHLVRQLIVSPIQAMIAGGLENPNDIFAQGTATATKFIFGTEPTPEGKKWLLEEWPRVQEVAIQVFHEQWQAMLPK